MKVLNYSALFFLIYIIFGTKWRLGGTGTPGLERRYVISSMAFLCPVEGAVSVPVFLDGLRNVNGI